MYWDYILLALNQAPVGSHQCTCCVWVGVCVFISVLVHLGHRLCKIRKRNVFVIHSGKRYIHFHAIIGLSCAYHSNLQLLLLTTDC